jgi:hypothetical protein
MDGDVSTTDDLNFGGSMQRTGRLQWFYWPPLIHLAICLIALLGYIVPSLQFLGILWSLLAIADIPVSIVTMGLAFSQHGVLAGVWVTVVGTLWWYLLCRAAAFLAGKMKGASSLPRSVK